MTIRSILAGASGGTASNGAVELACRFATRFGAHLEAFHVRLDVQQLVLAAGATGVAMPLDGRWIDEIAANADDMAAKTKAGFTEIAARHGLPVVETPEPGKASASWRDEAGDAPVVVSRRARFFDLVVLGRSDRVADQPHSDAIEQTLIQSGRPVLLAPAEPPAALGTAIAIGWNGSPQAVRAIVGALPFLREARQTFVIAIDDRDPEGADAIKDYLALQSVPATVRHVPKVSGGGTGDQLLSAAREEGADLLIMGGYGHAPWRETLFGGATRDIVGVSLLPLLISH
jgi:nucleotide-binding universal stress UspA family protein